MIKIDLITGFLGSGKTTFIKKYAAHFLRKGQRIGILENDFGAVNVDRMLLQELQGENCDIETIAGACDADCHKRRFKTKLIAMAMVGYDRVIVEPSGIYDTDEFFDTLREDPIERWYEMGTVLTIVDSGLDLSLSEGSKYLLASQLANAGAVILSRTQLYPESTVSQTTEFIKSLSSKLCSRDITNCILCRPWDEMTDSDLDALSQKGCFRNDHVKHLLPDRSFQSLYFMHNTFTSASLKNFIHTLFTDPSCGKVYRIKGYFQENSLWYECNADHTSLNITPAPTGQDILVIIGESLNPDYVRGFCPLTLPQETPSFDPASL